MHLVMLTCAIILKQLQENFIVGTKFLVQRCEITVSLRISTTRRGEGAASSDAARRGVARPRPTAGGATQVRGRGQLGRASAR